MIERSFPRLILSSAAALCLLLVALACGDDDADSELTLESYFARLEAITAETAMASGDLQDQYPDVFREVEDTQAYYDALLPAQRETFDQISDLEPPIEVEQQHQAYVDANDNFYAELAIVENEISQLESDVELAEYLDGLENDPALTIATNAVADACMNLQEIADENAITADLACGEGTDPTELAALGEYFSTVEDIFASADEQSTEAQATLDASLLNATLDQQKQALDVFLTEVESIFTDTINRLRAAGTPERVQDAQSDFIAAVEDQVESAEAFQEDLETIENGDQLEGRLSAFQEEIGSAVQRADAACVELKNIAEGRGIEVELGC